MTTALKVIAPMTGKVLERHLRDEQPLDPRVVTPAEIRERFREPPRLRRPSDGFATVCWHRIGGIPSMRCSAVFCCA